MLKQEIGWLENVERAKKPSRLPVVLTRSEVKRVFAHLHGTPKLMAGLLYGSGLRLMECGRLRVKDIDFALVQITVRDAKDGKDRVTMLPLNLSEPLRRHLLHRRERSGPRALCLRGYRKFSHVIFGPISPLRSLFNFSETPSSRAHFFK